MQAAATLGLFAALPHSVIAASPISKATAPKIAARKTDATLTPALAGWDYKFDDDELESTWTWAAKLSANDSFETRIVFNWQDDKNYQMLRLNGDGRTTTLRFWSVTNGHIEKLGDPEVTLPGNTVQLSLQRSAWRVRALWNGRSVVTASLGGSEAGKQKFGIATHGKATLDGPRMQPTEAIVFRDDFMRAQGPDDPEVPGQWHRASGVWKTSGLLGPRADAALNPNPFVFRTEASSIKPASTEATVGKWFWSDYVIEASVRPTVSNVNEALTAGLSAYRQADGTSIVGEVDFKEGIARLRQGSRILAESEPFNADLNQWHRLYLDPGPGMIRLVVDGVERLRYESDTTADSGPVRGDLAQGEASLVSNVGGGNYIDFDDVRLAQSDAFSDDFRTRSVGRWTDTVGEWQTRAASTELPGKVPARRVKLTTGPALSLANVGTRDEGRIEAAFVPQKGKGAAFGAAFAVRDARNYDLARVYPNRVEIVEYTDGVGKILGSSPKAATDSSVEVEWRDGAITARSGAATATANVNTIADGRAGVWADGPTGSWAAANFHALGAAPAWGEGDLPERFTKDRLMQYWAANASLWQAAPDDKTNTRWHAGDFFNDATLSLPLPTLKEGQKITIYGAASSIKPDAGSRLTVESAGNDVAFEIAEGGKVLKRVTMPAADAKGELRLALRPLGNGFVALRAVLPARLLFAETVKMASTDAANTKLGIRTDGSLDLDWDKVVAHASNVIDYSFTGAPTDWRAAKGYWNVKERWTCSPQWGFFAGVDSVTPTLWSRFALRGDWTLEAYIATPMDITRSERSPTDLNVTVGADGRDLASGYSFLFAANGRRSNRVYRGDEIATEQKFTMPAPKGSTHQDWFYVRLERRQTPQGLNFRYTVNGQEMWNYTDPNPLAAAVNTANHVAFWTYNGGLSIARVRLWYSGLENGEAATKTLVAARDSGKAVDAKTAGAKAPGAKTPGAGATDTQTAIATADGGKAGVSNVVLKNILGEWKPRRESLTQAVASLRPVMSLKQNALEISNTFSGGDWTVYAAQAPFDTRDRPILKFRYRVPQGVLVNLYARVENKWREITFTGNAVTLPRHTTGTATLPSDGGAPMGWGSDFYAGSNLGQIEGVTNDNAWHTATFDLLTALKKANISTKIDALAFAAPDRDYLRAGLGGNHLGATYWITDFDAPLADVKVATR